MTVQSVLSLRTLGIHDGVVRPIYDRLTIDAGGRVTTVERNVKPTDEEKAEHEVIFKAMIEHSATKTDYQSGWPDDG